MANRDEAIATLQRELEQARARVAELEAALSRASAPPGEVPPAMPFGALTSHSPDDWRAMLEFALDQSSMATFCADANARLIYANDSACRYMGYTREELLKLTVHDIDPNYPPDKWREHVKEIRKAKSRRIETIHQARDGRRIPVELTICHVEADGKGYHWSFAQEITQRKASEEALRQSEERFRLTIQNSPVNISTQDKDLRYTWIYNPQLGYTASDVVGKTDPDLLPNETACQVMALKHKAMTSGMRIRDEVSVAHAGTMLYYDFIVEPLRDRRGEIVGVTNIVWDITERKRAENALRESEERFRQLIETSAIPIAIVQPDGRLYLNSRFTATFGYTIDDIPTINDWWPKAYPDKAYRDNLVGRYTEFIRQAQEQGKAIPSIEATVCCKDGTYRNVDGYTSQLAGQLTVVLADITERKTAEAAVRESEARYRRLHESMRDAFVHVDMAGRIVDSNQSYRDMLGYTAEELSRLTYIDMTPQKWHAYEADLVKNQILARGYSDVYEKEYRRKNGEIFPVELRAFLIKDQNGKPAAIWGIARDITERKQAQLALQKAHDELELRVQQRTAELRKTNQALLESETNFRTFFESVTDMIFVASPEGRLLFTNAAVSRTLGFSPGELGQMDLLSLHPPDRRSEAETIFNEIIRGQRSGCPLPLTHKNGQLIPVETRVWFGRWNGKDCVFGISKNLTAEQEAQQRFERVFRGNPAPMALTSVPGRTFVDVNDAFLQVLGYSRSEIIGKTSAEIGIFVNPTEQAEVAARLERESHIAGLELQVRHKNGGIIDGVFSGESLYSQGRQYYLTVMLDITARKQAERALRDSEQRAKAIFNASNEVIVLLNPEGMILDANPTATFRLGGANKSILGANLYQLINPDLARSRKAHIDQVFQTGQPVRFEDERNGMDFDSNAFPVFNSQGRVSEVVVFARDITERKKAQLALQASEKQYRELVQNANSIIMRWAPDGRITFSNKFSHLFFGYSEQEMLGRHIAMFVPEGEDSVGRNLGQMLQDIVKRPHLYANNENENLCRDGRRVWIQWTNRAIRDNAGKIIEILSIGNDITERKKAEKDLETERRQLRTLIDNIPDAVYFKDIQGRFVVGNQALAADAGIASSDEMIGHTDFDFCHADLARKYRAEELKIFREGKGLSGTERIVKTLDGRTLWLSVTKVPLRDETGKVIGLVGINRDITSQKKTQEALRKQEEEYRTLIEHLSSGLVVHGPDTGILLSNPMASRLLGLTAEEMRAKTDLDPAWKFLKDDGTVMPVTEYPVNRVLSTGKSIRNQVVGIQRHDCSEPVWVLCSAYPVRDAGRQIQQIVADFADITQLRQAEKALRESEEKYRALIETTDTGFLILDETGTVMDANHAYVRLTGHKTLKEILGRRVTEWTAPNDLERNAREVRKCITKGFVRNLEVNYINRRGKVTPVEVNATVVNQGGQTRILSLCRDITVRHEAAEMQRLARRQILSAREEERKRFARELHDSVGQAMVVSDLKLKTIRQDLARKKQDGVPRSLEELSCHFRGLIGEIRQLSRGLYPPALEKMGLCAALRELVETWRSAKINVHLRCPKAVEKKRLPENIEIAMFRIAQEAISNAVRHGKPTLVTVSLAISSNDAVLSIINNGKPFKPDGAAGTGLGMMSMKERADIIGGEIQITSTRGETRVHVKVPTGRNPKTAEAALSTQRRGRTR